MPRAKTSLTTGRFQELHEHSKSIGDKNDCTVKAVTIITGLPYDEVRNVFRKHGRKNGRGVYLPTIEKVLNELGYKKEVISMRSFIESYPKGHRHLQSVTTHHPERFPKSFERADNLMLFTCRHVSAFKDGQVQDWAVGRAKRCYEIWHVVKKA